MHWKPDTETSESRVALLVLASWSVAVLIRTCKVGLPDEVIMFCSRCLSTAFNDSLDLTDLSELSEIGFKCTCLQVG